jgi:LPXTG-site transpeptidase (sortase) family protein
MSGHRRFRSRLSDAEASALLAELLAKPTPPPLDTSELLPALLPAARPPAALRRPATLRPIAAPRPARESSFDRMLLRGAQLSGVAALILCGFWFIDGPLYDLLHEASAAPVPQRMAQLASQLPQTVETMPSLAEHGTPSLPTAAPARAIDAGSSAQDDAALRAQATSQIEVALSLGDVAGGAERVAPDSLAPNIAPIKPAAHVSTSPDWLMIPAIGVNTQVVETYFIDYAWQSADYAAGYLYGTGIPGEVGNVVITGHAGLRGGVFQSLGVLKPGDAVYVERPGWRFTYVVRGQHVVWPNQIEVTLPEDTPVLTLITCTNWDTQRLVVVADLVGSQPLP